MGSQGHVIKDLVVISREEPFSSQALISYQWGHAMPNKAGQRAHGGCAHKGTATT